MSWSDLTRRAALAALVAAPLGGCFQPLYGPTAMGGADMAQELRSIAVDPIPDRFGPYLGNELIFQLNGTGTPAPVKYRLLVTLVSRVQSPIIDTVTSRASAATVWAEATYSVTPAAGQKSLRPSLSPMFFCNADLAPASSSAILPPAK